MSLKYKILPFDTPKASSKRGLLCIFQNVNLGGGYITAFPGPQGRLLKPTFLGVTEEVNVSHRAMAGSSAPT